MDESGASKTWSGGPTLGAQGRGNLTAAPILIAFGFALIEWHGPLREVWRDSQVSSCSLPEPLQHSDFGRILNTASPVIGRKVVHR